MPHKVSSRSGHSGHFWDYFRDLFFVQFSRKRSRKQDMICPECPEKIRFKKKTTVCLNNPKNKPLIFKKKIRIRYSTVKGTLSEFF